MVSVIYLNELSKRSRKGDMNARWKLGELLFEIQQEGHKIVNNKELEVIQVIKRCEDD